MPVHQPNGTRFMIALSAAAALTSCRGLFDSSVRAASIGFDIGALAGVQQGDFTSVARQAELTVSSGDIIHTMLTQSLAPDEPETVFEVELEDGEFTFSVGVLGDSGVLYQGATNATIDGDDFAVTIVPQPVSPVLVVLPRHPAFTSTDDGEIRTFTAFLRVRNPGLAGLVWRVDSLAALPPGVRIDCRLFQQDGISCLVNRTWTVGQDEIIEVSFETASGSGTLPTQGVPFISNVGGLTVPTTP